MCLKTGRGSSLNKPTVTPELVENLAKEIRVIASIKLCFDYSILLRG